MLIIGGGAAAMGGVAAGTVGGVQIGRAQKRIKMQASKHDARLEVHLQMVDQTNVALRMLGDTQTHAQRVIIHRMRDFLVRHAKQVRTHEHLILNGVDGANLRVFSLSPMDSDLAGWVRGVVGAASAGATMPFALSAVVVKYASASTGTPISTLSGAAAKNARLAFLGGGSLQSGGGGVKLGKTAGGLAAIGPAVLLAGVAVKNQGTKARTEAERHKTEVEVSIAALDTRDQLLRGVQERAQELQVLIGRMVARAEDALDRLESEPFDMSLHAELLQTALVLVKSVREVATAPVADEEGNIDAGTQSLIFTYRNIYEEPTDG
ncbi:hypothetical protein [Microbacterium sp. SY138]|uniref:hypothetical protein n=1 Tax=Microbacterium sp. SY138 TaxID=3149040 RepID=UPI00321A74E1